MPWECWSVDWPRIYGAFGQGTEQQGCRRAGRAGLQHASLTAADGAWELCVLGSLVLCWASGWGPSLLLDLPVGSSNPGCQPSSLSSQLSFWGLVHLGAPFTGLTQSGGQWLLYWGLLPPDNKGQGPCVLYLYLPCPAQGWGQMGPHLRELAEPTSKAMQYLKYHSSHRAAGIHRRLGGGGPHLGGGGPGTGPEKRNQELHGKGKKQGVLKWRVV